MNGTLLLLALACNKDPDRAAGGATIIEMSAFHGLEEGASWTFLSTDVSDDDDDDDDDGDDELTDLEVNEDDLLRVRYQGDGEMEFRRGSRWADAVDYGVLVWDTKDGLALKEWQHPRTQGDGDFQIADAYPDSGDVNGKNGWSCETDKELEFETFYGIFENVLVFDCTHDDDDDGLPGRFVFAEETGLIKLESNIFEYNLVAPW